MQLILVQATAWTGDSNSKLVFHSNKAQADACAFWAI
jgi:hypothetical protein